MHSETNTPEVRKSLFSLIVLCSLLGGVVGAYSFFIFSEKIFPEVISHLQTPVKKDASLTQESSTSPLKNLEKNIIEKISQVSPSVVSIIVKKDLVVYRSDPWGFFEQPVNNIKRKVGGGSGFFIKSDGSILTNKHVVSDQNADYTVISNDGTEYDAKILALDPLNDLAVIKIESKDTSVFPVSDIVENLKNIEIGSFTLAIGNALAEFQNSVSFGIISGKNRSIEANGEQLSDLIQTDAAINPGNSGGPLVNLDGEIIGINTAIAYNSNNIGFAISLTQKKVDYILKSIEKNGSIERPFIGVSYIENSPGVQSELKLGVDYGAYIIDEVGSVVTGSSAEKAGLEPGDIILEVTGQKITPSKNLGVILQDSIPGQSLQLKILKKSGEEKEIQLELGTQ